MRQRDDLPALLGHIAPARRPEDCLAVANADPRGAAEAIVRHRVVGLAARRIGDSTAGGDIRAALEAAVTRRRVLSGLLTDAWSELGAAVAGLGIAAAGIKGYSAVALYERPADRDAGDIDVMVNTVDDAWRLVGWLRRRGYDWCQYELPWIKRAPDGHIYGQAAVWKWHGEIPARIDVHFGGYSVRHCRLVPCPVEDRGLYRLDPLHNLPLLLGNAAGDFFVRLKDVNDIVLMLRTVAQEDWAPALEPVRAAGLGPFWNALLAEVLRTSDLSGYQRDLARRLRFRGTPGEHVPFGRQVWRARARATVADAYRAGRSERGAGTGLARAWSAYRYYRRPLRTTVAATCHHRGGAALLLDDLRHDVCVRLIPTSMIRALGDGKRPARAAGPAPATAHPLTGSGLLRAETAGRHCYVRAGGEVFATTVRYDLCSSQALHE